MITNRLAPGPRRSPLLFIFVTVFVDLLGYGMVVPLLPFYVQEFRGSAALVGLLASLYAALQFLCAPVLGSLSDRYGRRPVLLACLLGTATGYLLLGLATSLPVLILAIVVDGMTGANVATAQAYIADSTTPSERAHGLGVVGAAFGLGMVCGPMLGGGLALYGLHVPALVAAGVAFANVLFGTFILPESLPAHRRSQISWRAMNPATQVWAITRIATIRALLIAVFLLNLAFAGLQSNFPLFSSTRFGWDITQNAGFFAFVGVCAVLTQGVLIGKLQARFGEIRLVTVGLALMVFGLAALAVVPYAWLLFPVVGVLAFGSGTAIPALTSLISTRVPMEQQGQLMGGLHGILSLTMIAGPTLAGLAFAYVGTSAPYVLGSLSTLVALAAVAGAPWSSRRQAAARPPSPDLSPSE